MAVMCFDQIYTPFLHLQYLLSIPAFPSQFHTLLFKPTESTYYCQYVLECGAISCHIGSLSGMTSKDN